MADPSKFVEVFDDSQPFDLRDMCRAYLDTFNSTQFILFINDFKEGPTKVMMTKIALLYMHYTIIKQDHYFTKIFTKAQRNQIKESIMKKCKCFAHLGEFL